MAKRKWTAAEKKAFANRMKKARAKKSGTKKRSTPVARKRKSTRSKSSAPTATRKRRRSTTSSRPVSRRRRSSSRRGGSMKNQAISMVKDSLIAVGGGIAASAIANKLPIANPLLKTAAPAAIGIGLLLIGGKKNIAALKPLGTGMLVLSAIAMVRQKFPSLPLLAGEEEVYISPNELNYQGEDVDFSQYGVEEVMGVDEISSDIMDNDFVTAASL